MKTVEMDTNPLARHYESLKPRERFPLIVAAFLRGDDAERNHLLRSAPRDSFRIPDYYGLADGLQRIALRHSATLLEITASYRQAVGCMDEQERIELVAKGHAPQERFRGLARLLAYCFVIRVEAWNRLLAELKIDSEFFLKDIPGYNTICRATESMQAWAFTEAEARTYTCNKRQEDSQIASVESVLAEMRALLDAHLQYWS
jgi:hypothetical protein